MYNLKDGILDYEDVLVKLKQIETKSNGLIKKKENTPKTHYGYDIPHYIVGNGPKHIIILGGFHANEIISVDFVLKFMESIVNGETDIDFNDVTLDIIPLDNPEGYIIATSTIRTVIDKDMEDSEIEKIATEYYKNYREDNIQGAKEKKENTPVKERAIKKHHQMFKNATYECISERHKAIREQVKLMMEKENFPEGSMIDFKCNASGIEPNKSWLMNYNLYKMRQGIESYDYGTFNTIKNNVPGPVGVPTIDPYNFEQTIETKYVADLIEQTIKDGSYAGFIDYHGTGGCIEWEPSFKFDESFINDEKRYQITGINYQIAMNYANNTTCDMCLPDGQTKQMTYILTESADQAFDDGLKALYPAAILIELSRVWGGNPIAPYGNKKAYNNTINVNKKALVSTIRLMSRLKKLIDEDALVEYDIDEVNEAVRPRGK